ncbi:hypothetical protein ARMGADRAFT_1081289 [Armillaria gallica]|uniref:DUF6534 domain-containing protein n=1 Tax=Armillaria gallica TaxID=47427 RepID=A0A2H3D9D6_ARMGA|nr:hypothetical protein ARMGADRAFT_1081289 [Armillaria gallica]
MSSPTPILIPFNFTDFKIGLTLGAIYIGATIAAVFYGITVLQTAVYYKVNPNDPRIFRYTVALLWVLDTLHVALSTHALYFYLIESFGNYLGLLKVIWSFPLQLVFNMLIATCVQALYAIRIWKRSSSFIEISVSNSSALIVGRHFHVVLPYFIFLAVAATFGTGLYAIYDTYTLSSFVGISTIRTSIYAVFSTMVGADFTISGAMCYYLHKGKSMTNLSSTTRTIVRLMRVVVISGLLTSACSLLTLVTYIVWPDTLIFMALGTFILPKLYINSLLAMLNSRKSSMWSHGSTPHIDQGLKIMRFAPHGDESGIVDSGQMNFAIPGLSVTGAETYTSSSNGRKQFKH